MPGQRMVKDLTKMHNSIFHLTTTIKSFAAATMGAPEIAPTASFIAGLPAFDIVKLGQDESSKTLIASVDGERGLFFKNEAAWEALDAAGVNPIPASALIESIAEHLVFLHEVMVARPDIKMEAFDKAGQVPILDLAEGYATGAPWVETTIRYGGHFGYCQKERTITLEELLQRRKARTRVGRRANRKAARSQIQASLKKDRDEAQVIKAKAKALRNLKDKAQMAQAQTELARLQAQRKEDLLRRAAERRELGRMSKYGYHKQDRKRFFDLRYVDPRPMSKSHRKWVQTGGRLGFIRRSFAKTVAVSCLRILCCCCICYAYYLYYCAYFLCCCCLCKAMLGSNTKPTVQEKKLLRVMRFEQKKRDSEIKRYVSLATAAVAQLNLLFPRLQKALNNSLGYKLSLGSAVLRMKQDFAELASKVNAKKLAMSQAGAAKDFAKESAMHALTNVRPKFKMVTDYSLLMAGKSPIVELGIDFDIRGEGDEGEEEEMGGATEDEAVEGGDVPSFKFDKKAFIDAMPPRVRRLYELFFDFDSPRNLVNIFKTLALGLLNVIKNSAVFLYQASNFVRKCLPPFPVISDVTSEIGMLVMSLDFSLHALPYKLARSLKRVLMLPKDIYRFYGSTTLLLKMLVSMMGKSANQLPPPKKLKMIKAAEDLEVGEEEGDDDDELSADDEPPPELPGELGEAAKEASRAAEEASSIPDQPPAFDPRSAIDMAIAAELEDGASDQEDDDDEDEGEDEDDIEPEDEEPDVDLDETEEHGESPKDEAPKAGGMVRE
uniref:Uncharacterized protein n=1 Tax=Chrysotila carterae TaxID=13221 RepID=A0A7S4C384_CHRCT